MFALRAKRISPSSSGIVNLHELERGQIQQLGAVVAVEHAQMGSAWKPPPLLRSKTVRATPRSTSSKLAPAMAAHA